MSSPTKYKIVDVKGDGSCFFRSIYKVAESKRMINRVLKKMGRQNKSSSSIDEDAFVVFFRKGLAERIIANKDYGVIHDVYITLQGLSKQDYRVILESSFPSWFVRKFGKNLPPKEEDFRVSFATSVSETKSNWASEIEVTVVKEIFKREMKANFIVFNSPPKKTYPFLKSGWYLLNRGEVHYNAIIVKFANDTTSPKKSKMRMKNIASPKQKECKATHVLNPETKRCVLRNSCKGYEIIVKQLNI